MYTWEDCFKQVGTIIEYNSKVRFISHGWNMDESNKNVFYSETQAKSALAFAQLTHILNKVYEDYVWRPDWDSDDQEKSIILRMNNTIHFDTTWSHYSFLAFPTSDIRDLVYNQNKELVHDYLMIELP
jgi:hypothetical protein